MQYLITGNTYPLKRTIKWFWGFWNKENQGWIIKEKTKETEKFITDNKLEIKEIKEEIKRAEKIDIQLDRAKRKIEMYEKRINRAEMNFKQEAEKYNTLTHNRDYSFITQPCNWHRGMIKAKQRADVTMEKRYWKWWYFDQQKEANSKLNYWKNELKRLKDKKAWKWKNAKQRKEEKIEKIKETLKVWDKVDTIFLQWNDWRIYKIFKKTVRLINENNVISSPQDIAFLK